VSTWSELNNEGVRLAGEGDLAAARDKLAAALAVAPPEIRAQSLLNLAQVVDLTGERQHAVDLLTEALATVEGPARAMVVAARADILPWLDRWDEAWQDVETALVDAEAAEQVALRHSRVGLLMMAGRLVEAEREATATVTLAARHAPGYLSNLYASLALLADEAGDERQAETYRRLGDNPGHEPRWPRFVERNAEGVVLASSGDRMGAAVAFEDAYRETVGSDDAEALACRAGAAGNLAGVAEDYAGAVRWSTEAITAARSALALVGDVYGTATTLVNALVSRATAHFAHTRLSEALVDLDEALTVDGAVDAVPYATVRAVRARVLATGGRYAEAAREARSALDLAYASAPVLAANIHMTLAEITSDTGDLPGAVEHLAVARDLCAATGDVAGQATAVLSSARLAYLSSDGDRADALYDEAEALLAGDPRQLAACLLGRAAVEVLRGRPTDAVGLVDRAHASLGPAATPLELVAVHQVRGSACEAAGDFAAAEACYADAAAGCAAAGLWHVALGMAWWRADALVRRAAAVTGGQRRAIAERALDLALPAALASEAVRQRFPHGRLRERWVALASAPAIRSAFLAIRAVEDVELAAAYVDHLAGAVSFAAGTALPVARGELVSLPEPPVAASHLPYAAAGLPSGGYPTAGFELPPRVRLDPALPSTLDTWLDVAEERYGFPVRSTRAVASW
jgi:tetratricopeptide (TPR) repeat protein